MDVHEQRYSVELGEAGSSDLRLHNRRLSSEHSLHERRSQPYRSEDEPEQDLSEFQYATNEQWSYEQQAYVYDAKKDMEKGTHPYGVCCGLYLPTFLVEGKGASHLETNFEEVEGTDFDDPNLEYDGDYIDFGMLLSSSLRPET